MYRNLNILNLTGNGVRLATHIVSQVAHMPCYVVEYLWHVLLGESGRLPWRSEDIRLPLALRFEGGRDTRALDATVAVRLSHACHAM